MSTAVTAPRSALEIATAMWEERQTGRLRREACGACRQCGGRHEGARECAARATRNNSAPALSPVEREKEERRGGFGG